ncbi:MAG: DsrE family protein [Thermodesulfobacteriota bacterium]|nr:DsrE family protein [Thermodesulfobacteriota bacterium]
MAKSLGIFVTSNDHLDKIIRLCEAAKKKEIEVSIFFTHFGILATQDPKFVELGELARMSVCNVSFKGHGLTPPVPCIGEKDFATQARHAEIIEECDRYLVF